MIHKPHNDRAGAKAPARLLRLARLLLVYAMASAAGAFAVKISLPLPWMLGPFFLFAALSATGRRFSVMPMGRELAQVAIGLAIGLRFTPAVLAATALLLPHMIGATLYLMIVTTCAAILFRPMAAVDPVTAFFATAAGGVADMATVAQRFGGAPSSVAVVHAMRVSLVVALVPFVVLYLGESAPRATVSTGVAQGHPWLDGAALVAGLVAAYLMALVLRPTALPNPWLLGPILAGMAIGLSDLVNIHVPGWMITVAQIFLGTWLGCQFRRDLLASLPRVTASAFAIGLFLITAAALGAVVLASVAGLPFSTAFLSLAPAAVTEMVLVAKLMGLDAATVAAFHVMRIAIVSTTILLVYRLYSQLNGDRNGSGI